MICKNCQKEIPENEKVCPHCGEKTSAKSGKEKKKFKDLDKKSKIIRIAIACVCFLVAGVLIFNDAITGMFKSGDTEDPAIATVKSGTLDYFPEPTVGEAFEKFFAEPEWKTFTSEEGLTIVEFTGKCTLDGEDADCLIQFSVSKDNTFETYYAEIDKEKLSDEDILTVYETVYGHEAISPATDSEEEAVNEEETDESVSSYSFDFTAEEFIAAFNENEYDIYVDPDDFYYDEDFDAYTADYEDIALLISTDNDDYVTEIGFLFTDDDISFAALACYYTITCDLICPVNDSSYYSETLTELTESEDGTLEKDGLLYISEDADGINYISISLAA